jgi:hypothetical protein
MAILSQVALANHFGDDVAQLLPVLRMPPK